MIKKALLIGGGGHCHSVLDSLLSSAQYSEIGIIDKKENIGKRILGIPVIGSDEELSELYRQGYSDVFVTIGSIGDPTLRVNIFHLVEQIGFHTPNVIDSSAIVSNHAKLDQGIFVAKGAVVNAGAHLHRGIIINTSAIIEHDCVIGEFSHIATGSVLSGRVTVGSESHIGAGTVIKQGVKIGSHTMIGMGSVVLQDVGDDVIAFGHPCKEVRQR
nr:acetyltransferase [Bacilli bacterium]